MNDAATPSQATDATDASVLINGVTITNSDNTLDDVVQGVTFTLNDTSNSAVRVSVAGDEDGMISKIQSFVSAYNSIISYIGSQSIYDQDHNTRGPLLGESTSSRLVQNIHSVIADTYNASSVISALSEIGFSTAQTGYLEVDTDTLRTALSSHLDDVTALFTDSNGVLNAVQDVLDRYVNVTSDTDYEPAITNRVDSLSDQISNLDDDISTFDDRMTAYEDRLRRQFTAMELALGRLQEAQNTLNALLPSSARSNSSSSSSN